MRHAHIALPEEAADLFPDIERWYCVRTDNGAELTVDIAIRLAGFMLFAPTLWKPATLARRGVTGSIIPARPDRIVPLFHRYLFVRLNRGDPAWCRIEDLDGVDYVFSSGPESPTGVPEEAIELIRGLCAPNGCVYPPNHATRRKPLAIGAAVTLTSGPMSELSGGLLILD